MKNLLSLLVLCALVSCGGGSAPNGGQTRFLLLAHVPLAGQLSSAPDAQLLDIGSRACSEMNAGTSSDRIVEGLGNNPEPGSAEYNAFSYVIVAAATELCPKHKAEFSGGMTP